MTKIVDANPADRLGGRDEPTTSRTNPFAAMPRCGAKTRSGAPCQRIGNARNGRCILHGGRAGAPKGERNGSWRHGHYTAEAKAHRLRLRKLIRDMQRLVEDST